MAKKSVAKKPARPPASTFSTERWARLVIVATIALLPLSFSPALYEQWHLPKVALIRMGVGLALLLWAIMVYSRNAFVPRANPGWRALALLVLLALVSTAASPDVNTALWGVYGHYEGAITYMVYALIFMLAACLFRSAADKRLAAIAVVVSGAAVAFYGLLQFLGLDFLNWGEMPFGSNRIFATFGNPTYLATFLAAALPLAIAAASERLPRHRVPGLIGSALIGIALVLTFTRSAWIAAVIELPVLYFVLRSFRPRGRSTQIVFGLLIFSALAAFILAVSATGASEAIPRLKASFNVAEGSAGSRVKIYETAAAVIADKPFFGVGPDRFRFGFAVHKPAEYVIKEMHPKTPDDAHNYLINMAATAGLPASVVFMFFLVLTWAASWRQAGKKDDNHVWTKVWLVSAAGALTALMFTPSEPGGTFWIWFGLGAGASSWMTQAQEKRRKDVWFKSSLLMISIVTVSFLWISSCMLLIADRDYMRAREIFMEAPDEALAKATQAIRLYPYSDTYHFGRGQLLQARAYTMNDESAFGVAVNAYQEAIKRLPGSYTLRLELAGAYGEAAKRFGIKYYEPMITVLQEAKALDPKDPRLWRMLAQAYRGIGNNEAQVAAQKELDRLSPDKYEK